MFQGKKDAPAIARTGGIADLRHRLAICCEYAFHLVRVHSWVDARGERPRTVGEPHDQIPLTTDPRVGKCEDVLAEFSLLTF
jgi:hypothetical protein